MSVSRTCLGLALSLSPVLAYAQGAELGALFDRSGAVELKAFSQGAPPPVPFVERDTRAGVDPAGRQGPSYFKDVFRSYPECAAADVTFVQRPRLEDAARMLAPCMEAFSRAWGVSVKAEAAANRRGEPGIVILVEGQAGTDAVVDALEASLAARGGSLLTYRAEVRDRLELRASSLQAVIDGCLKSPAAHYLPPVEDARGFVGAYRTCLEAASQARIQGVYAVGERRVAVLSRARLSDLLAMNGKVSVPGAEGPVELRIRATSSMNRLQLRERP